MSVAAPKIDSRSASDLVARLVALLAQYTTHPNEPAQQYPFHRWQEYDPVTGAPGGRSAALIGTFARFGELVIERLNQVPDKNFLAFLDLLGAERQPPQPARVPITFALTAGATIEAQVPQGTQVAAPPAPGAKDPIVFETESPLVVTAASLSSLLTLDPDQDSDGDWSDRLAAPSRFPVFEGDRASDHVFYVGDGELLAYPQIGNLTVSVTLGASVPVPSDERGVRWECWDGTGWRLLTPTVDGTNNLTASGTIEFGPFQPLPETAVNLRLSRWLRCRLVTPVTISPVGLAGMVRALHLPLVKGIDVTAQVQRAVDAGVTPELGYINAAPLDLSKEFFPFGETPKLHDTLALASAEAFSKGAAADGSYPGASIDIDVQLANSHLVPGSGSVRPSMDLELAWECWGSGAWQRVGTSVAPSWLSLLELDPTPSLLTETMVTGGTVTSAIVQGTAQLGAQVASQVPSPSGGTDVRYLSVGADGRFADKRALVNGVNVFEFDASYQDQTQARTSKAWSVIVYGAPPTVALTVAAPTQPVDVDVWKLDVTISGANAASVNTLQVTNGRTGDGVKSAPTGPVQVKLVEGRNELLVEALAADGTTRLAAAGLTVSRRAAAPPPDAGGFSDGTFGLCQSGVVTLRLPDATAPTVVNGQESYWLRVRLTKGNYGRDASYVLKNPVKPDDGFTLVPASFRPPIVAVIRIGYEFAPHRSPEVCLTYNQLAFEDSTDAAAGKAPAFAPFAAGSEVQQPGLYLGFSLPPGRSAFPNTTISVYNRVADIRYGERAVPLSPEVNVSAGAAGSTVTYALTISNVSAQPEEFDIEVLGCSWATITTTATSLEAGATGELAVQVTVPAGAQPGDSDRCFVRLRARSEPETIYSVVVLTSVGVLPSAEPPAVAWQYWDGTRWTKLAVQDGSENFTRSGLIEFLAPSDLAQREMFGRSRYWLRVEWDRGRYSVPPRLSQILLNTTVARQTITVVNEILGSSGGVEQQQFQSARVPVLAGQQLEVREPEMPSTEEQATLKEEEGDGAINVVADAAGRPREIWVRWHEVPDFYGSGARDRHYMINHLTGEIRFGDGVNGRVPPRGSGNLRLRRYQTGGGSVGNCAAGTIAQLKTAVPYVEKPTNPEAAAGGAEAEDTSALLQRMPRTLRHRDRAVTVEDYEDIALLASQEVVRSRCVPLRDLLADPLGDAPQAGVVSVIIVPRTGDAKPLPTLELIARVSDYLMARAPATASVIVVGPLYVRVDVTAEIALSAADGASAVGRAVHDRLDAFLHPLTGGLSGDGWDFGRAPHRSDFFSLIESVPGVDHVRYLQLAEIEDQPGVRATGRFLVFSGEHQIDLVFEED